jgi:hypothetical protein
MTKKSKKTIETKDTQPTNTTTNNQKNLDTTEQKEIHVFHWQDYAWKWLFKIAGIDAIIYFMPDLYALFAPDTEVNIIMDAPLGQHEADSDKGRKLPDLILKISKLRADDTNITCLIKQQHDRKKDFTERLFTSLIRLRRQCKEKEKLTAFVIYTNGVNNLDHHTENFLSLSWTVNFDTFDLMSCDVEELRRDKRPFALAIYAAFMANKYRNDFTQREKIAWEILKKSRKKAYTENQKLYTLQFARRILNLNSDLINKKLKEAYVMATSPSQEHLWEQLEREADLSHAV